MSDEKKSRRKTPPEANEWADIWEAIDKANYAWIVVGPIHALVKNWKALIVIAGVVVWLNNARIIQALSVIMGVTP